MNTNYKHTEGKWVISHGANYIPSIGSASLHQPIAHLCNMTEAKGFCEETEANARLISCAPEMLTTLIEAQNHFAGVIAYRSLTPAESELHVKLLSIINKATDNINKNL
jgi:hypothetical protein